MSVQLTRDGDAIEGVLALEVAPGTLAQAQSRAIDLALSEALTAEADALGCVLGAAPSRFARQLPGKDAEGRVRFSVRARVEGDRLVPDHKRSTR